MFHVLIERHIAKGMLSTYEKNSRSALQQTCLEHGFVSGELLIDDNDENHRFLLCKWRKKENWERWYHSRDRMELMNTIIPILAYPEKITVLTVAG